MTALNPYAATAVLEVPTEPFTSLEYGDHVFAGWGGEPLSTPHPVRIVDGIPGIPRRNGMAGVQSLSSGPAPIPTPLIGATFVAFRGAFDSSSSYSNPGVQMCYYTSSICTAQLYSAYVHNAYVIDDTFALSVPHVADGISVYAFVNSSSEAFVANSLQGVLNSIAAVTENPGSSNASIGYSSEVGELDVLGIWHFADIEVSQADAVDTMDAIIALIEAGPAPISAGSAIGPEYMSKLVQAVLGPAHSPVFPDTLWSGWLDGDGDVVSMTGMTVPHDDWGPVAGGVTNIAIIDGGVMPATPVERFALFDAKEGGDLVIKSVPVTFSMAPSEGQPLLAQPGSIVFLGDAEAVTPE